MLRGLTAVVRDAALAAVVHSTALNDGLPRGGFAPLLEKRLAQSGPVTRSVRVVTVNPVR